MEERKKYSLPRKIFKVYDFNQLISLNAAFFIQKRTSKVTWKKREGVWMVMHVERSGKLEEGKKWRDEGTSWKKWSWTGEGRRPQSAASRCDLIIGNGKVLGGTRERIQRLFSRSARQREENFAF